MPAKAKKKTTKAPAKKAARAKKGGAYECRVCGYRLVVDNVCGCEDEHVMVCCDQPMKKARARK